MNDEPQQYQENNDLQKRDCEVCLQKYGFRINWKEADRIIDIGCGDGSVTATVLKKFIKTNFKFLMGSDLSKEMVKHANSHHRSDKIYFNVLDIERNLPNEFKGKFDHVFSFYALHWVYKQEKAFRNIYEVLDQGGECFVVFLAKSPTYNAYRALAATEKWRKLITDVEYHISPYFDMDDPQKELHRIMSMVGFKDIYIDVHQSVFDYGNAENVKKGFMSVDPFDIPKYLHEEYMNDYFDVLVKEKLVDVSEPNTFKTVFSLLVAYGKK